MDRNFDKENFFMDYVLVDFVPEPSPEKIRQTVCAGTEFMSRNIPEKTSKITLMREQLRYISPLFWASQIGLMTVAVLLVSILPQEMNKASELIFQLTPFISFLALPEMMKDIYWDMLELESSCKNSGSVIFAVRLTIVGFVNIFVLTVIAAILSGAYGEKFFSTILHGLTPFVWVNVFNLILMKVLTIKSRLGAVMISVVSILVVSTVNTRVDIVAEGQIGTVQIGAGQIGAGNELIWLGAFIVGALILAAEVVLLLKERKREGVSLWN